MPVAEVGPIALCFQSEHPLGGLPAISDLPTGETSGTIPAPVSDHCTYSSDEIPAITALTPAAVGADVETAPVIKHRKRGRRRCLGSKVSGRRWSGHAESNQTDSAQQKLLHIHIISPFIHIISFLFVSLASFGSEAR